MSGVVSEILRDQIHRLASREMREDGRSFDEARKLSIEVGILEMAEGSARVRLGDTDVLVGVKIDVGTPFPDKPAEGILMTGAELRPIAHPDFESGPPSHDAVELARVADRGIRESCMIVLKKLAIAPGEKVYMVHVDVQPLDHYGNLFDAATAGAVAALRHSVVPASRFGFGPDFPLPVQESPVSSTFVKIGTHIMLDPTLREELVADARLTVTTDSNGDIRALQKGLSGAFTFSELKDCVQLARRKAAGVRAQVLA
ncbi:MAG: exosome complex protein Rrp42 [Methanobacteriota archaeon]